MAQETVSEKIKKTEKKILALVHRYGLLMAGRTYLVGVSGGADSMALLHFLWQHRNQLHIHVLAAHLDHGLRPKESAEERQMVMDYCQHHGIPLFSKKTDVSGYAQAQPDRNIENAARALRYDFLRQVAAICDADGICVAHHQDDQAETILMHICRGCGLQGLGGMAPKTEDILRPFLGISKEEILSLCQHYGISYATDQSNFDLHYLRNRIRWELLPLLRDYNPAIVSALINLGEVAREEEAYLQVETEKIYDAIHPHLEENQGRFDALVFSLLPMAAKRRFLQCFFRKFQAERGMISNTTENRKKCLEKGTGEISLFFSHIDGICQLKEGEQMVLPGDIQCLRAKGHYYFSPLLRQKSPAKVDNYALTEIGEETVYTFSGFPGQVRVIPVQQVYLTFDGITIVDGNTLFIPAAHSTHISLCTRKEGYRFSPQGMAGSMKLKKYFINEKIPVAQRNCWPLVVKSGNVLWVIGKRFANGMNGMNGVEKIDIGDRIQENGQVKKITKDSFSDSRPDHMCSGWYVIYEMPKKGV